MAPSPFGALGACPVRLYGLDAPVPDKTASETTISHGNKRCENSLRPNRKYYNLTHIGIVWDSDALKTNGDCTRRARHVQLLCNWYNLRFWWQSNIQITVLWDMTPCSLGDKYRGFEGNCFLHISSETVTQFYQTTRRHVLQGRDWIGWWEYSIIKRGYFVNTPWSKVWRSLNGLPQKLSVSEFLWTSHETIPPPPEITPKAKIRAKFSVSHLVKVWFYITHIFTILINGERCCVSSTSAFTQICREIWKIRLEIHKPKSTMAFTMSIFTKLRFLDIVLKRSHIRNFMKWDKGIRRWYCVTDGWACFPHQALFVYFV